MARFAEDALAEIPLFSHLSQRALRKLARSVIEDRYEAGTTIVREGGTTSTMFVVMEGEAKVVRDGRTISKRRPGEFFGELAMIDGRARAASVIAETPIRLLVLRQDMLRKLVMNDPRVAWAMLQSLSSRLRGE
jgi:CRP-like cAMP-binding protein